MALVAWKGRGTLERITQLLIAAVIKLGPDAQSAFVGADPGAEFDALGDEEAGLELAVVRDVVVGAPEANSLRVFAVANPNSECSVLPSSINSPCGGPA